MPRPISAVISTQAMAHNFAQARARIEACRRSLPTKSASVKVFAVVKANAYGHGTLNALKGFSQADGLGMIDLSEAVLCRENGWNKTILLLEGFFHAVDIELLQQYQVTTAIHSFYQIDLLAQAKNVGKPIDVMMKFNTGMNRLGFKVEQATEVLKLLQALQQKGIVGRIGCMSHFANADVSQDAVSEAVTQILQPYQIVDGPLSICNSAASIRYPHFALQAFENWVRLGICLYGSVPFDSEVVGLEDVKFLPTMTLAADIIGIQTLQAGDSVGYGSLFSADKPMRIAIVACGYADGYPRSAALDTPVTVAGVLSRIVGRVSMDMLTVDVTHIPQASVGSRVVLWGEGGPSIDIVAEHAGRIGYELMCGLTKRVPVTVV